MSHSFTNLLYHLVFSTKLREPWLDASWRGELFAYLGGIVRDLGGIALEVNGIEDHVHLLVKLTASHRLCDVLREIKAGSSRWIHKRDEALLGFAWQTGYGAFTVSQSMLAVVRQYIQNQEEHHRKQAFTDEMRQLARLNGFEGDEEFFWE